jgi:hypothetical protein
LLRGVSLRAHFLPLLGIERSFAVAFQFGLEEHQLWLVFGERVGAHETAVAETTKLVDEPELLLVRIKLGRSRPLNGSVRT